MQTEEGVLLYASAGTDLARRLPGPGGEVLGPPITVEGSCYALGDYPRLTSQLPGYLIDEYAEEHALPPTTRVIEIDHGPGAVMMIGALPIGCCALPLLALAGFALVKSRKA